MSDLDKLADEYLPPDLKSSKLKVKAKGHIATILTDDPNEPYYYDIHAIPDYSPDDKVFTPKKRKRL